MFAVPPPILPFALPKNLTLKLEKRGTQTGVDEDTGNPIYASTSIEVKCSVVESNMLPDDQELAGPNTIITLVEGYMINPKVVPTGYDLSPNNRVKAAYLDTALGKTRYGEFQILPTVVPFGHVLATHIGTWIFGKLIFDGGAKTW
jgi:hypothetical protein